VSYLGQQVLPFDPTRTLAPPRDADRFSGNGSTVTFTLSRSVQLETDIEVFVANVQQEPITAYTTSGTSLTFTAAPASGTNNIYVVYKNFNSGAQVTVPDGSITYAKLANNIRLFTTDNLTPDGSTTVFTLSETPADANTLIVSVDGIVQRAPVHYTVSSNQITFTSAPQSSSNVHVRHLGFRTSAIVTALAASSTISTPTIQSPTFTGVSGFPDGSASAPSIFRAGDTNTGFFFPAADTVATTTGGTERLRIDSSGNVGIGTSSPETKLHVQSGDILISNNNYIRGKNSAGSNSILIGRNASDELIVGDAAFDNPTKIRTGNNSVSIETNSSERMRIDSSGNVGIGTTAPSDKLHVIGQNNTPSITNGVFNGVLLIGNSQGGYGSLEIGSRYDDLYAWIQGRRLGESVAGTLAINPLGGNVGIGTSSPNKKLEVVGTGEIIRATSTTGASDQLISVKNNSGTADTSTNIFFADRYAASSYASSYIRGTASGTSVLIFATGGTNFTNIYDAGAPTEKMRINSSGNVGIGTSSPDALLTVNTIASFGAGATGTPSIAAKGDLNTGMWFPAADTLAASTGGTERIRMDSSGNFGIRSSGTTAPTYDFNTLGEGLFLRYYDTTSGGIRSADLVGIANTPAGAAMVMRFLLNTGGSPGTAVERMRIDSSGLLCINSTSAFGDAYQNILIQNSVRGNAIVCKPETNATVNAYVFQNNSGGTAGYIQYTSTTTTYATSSDYRAKENIAPMTGALEKVAQLKPCTYTWKANGSDGQGFIAHELQAVVPDCVTGEKDAVDEDGNPVYQGVDTSYLVATLTAAIQELKVENDALKARLDAANL